MGKAFGKIIDSVITGIKISLQRRLIQRFHSSLKHNDTGYYFYYEPQQITVLDYGAVLRFLPWPGQGGLESLSGKQ